MNINVEKTKYDSSGSPRAREEGGACRQARRRSEGPHPPLEYHLPRSASACSRSDRAGLRAQKTTPPPRRAHSHAPFSVPSRSLFHDGCKIKGGARRAQAQWAAEVATKEEESAHAALCEGRRAPPLLSAPPPGGSGLSHVPPDSGSSPPSPYVGAARGCLPLRQPRWRSTPQSSISDMLKKMF